jgi:hypothetical protein
MLAGRLIILYSEDLEVAEDMAIAGGLGSIYRL